MKEYQDLKDRMERALIEGDYQTALRLSQELDEYMVADLKKQVAKKKGDSAA